MPNIKEKIKKGCTSLLLCEGNDEKYFLIYYLAYLIHHDARFEKIQVMDFGGIKDLKVRLKTLTGIENFRYVNRIAIIRDAETDWRAAESSVQHSIIESGLDNNIFSPMPLYLFPGKSSGDWINGTLEDLCTEIIKTDSQENEIFIQSEEYINEISDIRGQKFKRKHKNLLHAYFSATDDFVGAKIGEAAKIGAFDWQSNKLEGLHEFLCALIED